MGSANGCCCGVVIGFIAALLVIAAIGFGIYCWNNPEAKESSIEIIDRQWHSVKSGIDSGIDNLKNSPEKVD